MGEWFGDGFASLLSECRLTTTSAFCYIFMERQKHLTRAESGSTFFVASCEIVRQPMWAPTLILRAKACDAQNVITKTCTASESSHADDYV